MIKKIEAPNDLIPLFNLPGQHDEQLPCDRSAWIQWMTEQVGRGNKRVGVWVYRGDSGSIKAYAVAIDNTYRPISDSVMLVCFWSISPSWSESIVGSAELLSEVRRWAFGIGARRVVSSIPAFENHKPMRSTAVMEWSSV